MSITYDEVYISTIREIKICKDYIKKYEKEISKLEKKLGINVNDAIAKYQKLYMNNKTKTSADGQLKKIYDLKLALEKEKKRLKELEELLK